MRSTLCRLAVAATLTCAAPAASWSCAACGCTLSSDAATGYSANAGFRLNIQYDYLHQDRLRSGTGSASGVPDGHELERETLNRYFTLGLGYNPNPDWAVDLRVPYVVRTHSTYGEYDSTQALPDLSYSRSSSLGDIKIIGSYQGFLPLHNLGVQLGMKLPTGQYGTHVKFNAGPAAGTPLDTSLQPGTGSTDLILGAYYVHSLGPDLGLIVNAQHQRAIKQNLDQPDDDFRPGNSTTVSLGLRYVANPSWVPQLQFNFLRKEADQGALADTFGSAGTVVYLSPGISVKPVTKVQVYLFAQVPVYSNLNDYQLFPRWTASAGAMFSF